MVHRDDRGAQSWNGVHVTHRTTVAYIVDIDNVGPDGALLAGFEMFRYAGESLDGLIREARDAGKRILPIGAGWARARRRLFSRRSRSGSATPAATCCRIPRRQRRS